MKPPPLEQPTRPTRWDLLLVGLMLLVLVLPYAFAGNLALCGVGAAQLVPLVWRRAHPIAVFGIVAVCTLAQVPFSTNVEVFNVGLMVALYAVICWITDRRVVAGAIAVCVIGAGVAGWDWHLGNTADGSADITALFANALGCLIVTAASASLGLAGRRRRELMVELHERAADAERERDQHARLAAQSERTRIAREMHDVVAHALAVIVVQSDGAAYAVRHTGTVDAATQALETIGRTSRDALAETRRLVGVLRQADEGLELAPAVSAAEVTALVDRVRDAGLRVDLHGAEQLTGSPREMVAAAHRIVQEGLTNVIKHAGPDPHADVTVTQEKGALRVVVADDGRGPAADGSDGLGHGLVGMRERVSVLGGELATGPRPGGGFRLAATIPISTPPTPEHEQQTTEETT